MDPEYKNLDSLFIEVAGGHRNGQIPGFLVSLVTGLEQLMKFWAPS